jgi:hypothetical protein
MFYIFIFWLQLSLTLLLIAPFSHLLSLINFTAKSSFTVSLEIFSSLISHFFSFYNLQLPLHKIKFQAFLLSRSSQGQAQDDGGA